MARTKANTKPRFKQNPSLIWLEEIGKKVGYGGNPVHKMNPGDFGLTPPCSPRTDETLCDGACICKKNEALSLIREAIKKGMVSEQERNGFPQLIWAVSPNGVPLEAQLENQLLGTYHGYPLQESSPLWGKVIERWKAQS